MGKHPGSIDQHGSQWRVRLSVGGKRYRFTLDGATDREEVEGFARSKYDELRRRNGRGLPGPMRFSELLERFEEVRLPTKADNTQRTYRHSLKAFRTYFVDQGGDPMAHEVRPGHVEGFMHWRTTNSPSGEAREVSARTVAKDRAVLHSTFRLAQKLEIVQGNPVAAVDAPKGDSRQPIILTADQYEELLKACEDSILRTFVLVLGETGVRCESEATWLRWVDVDFESGFLTVESVRKGRRTKSGKARKVPMTRRLRDALREHAALYRMALYDGKRSEWVFHHPVSRRTAKAGARIHSLRSAFRSATLRAGLPADLNQHDLRHRRVTTWLAEGKSAVLVQKAMGHSDLQTTMRYTHLVAEDLLSLVESDGDGQRRAAGDR